MAPPAAYLVFARTVLPRLPQFLDFPLWNLHTIRGFWALLSSGSPTPADALTLACMAAGLAGFVAFERRVRGVGH